MNEDFDWAVSFVLKAEGGFQKSAKDKGNYRPDGTLVGTKYGISARSYPTLDIPNLTLEQAKQIYFEDYWTPIMSEVSTWLPPSAKLTVFDFGVNAGVARSLRFWRDADGSARRFNSQRIRFYTRLQSFTDFGRGWMNRMADIMEYAATNDLQFRRVFVMLGPIQIPLAYSKASVVMDKLYLRLW